MERFYEKLIIKFNSFTCKHELIRQRIDCHDKLYPIDWQWIDAEEDSVQMIKYRAAKLHPEMIGDLKFY